MEGEQGQQHAAEEKNQWLQKIYEISAQKAEGV